MRFALTEDQIALRDAVRELLARPCPPAGVRAAWPAATRPLWTRCGRAGRDGRARRAPCPSATAGSGWTRRDLVPLLVEVGYAARAAAGGGDGGGGRAAARRGRRPGGRLAGIAAGRPARALAGTGAGAVAATPAPSWSLAPDGGAPGSWPADRRRAVSTVDGSRARRLAPDRRPARLGAPRTPTLRRRRAGRLRGGDLATAAQLVGLGRADARADRRRTSGSAQQFGVPVGRFQAVKHQLADALLRAGVRRARWCSRRAGRWRAAPTPPSATSSAAALLAAEAARVVARAAIQCHGAIGYTVGVRPAPVRQADLGAARPSRRR